jgi:hypothetical protein
MKIKYNKIWKSFLVLSVVAGFGTGCKKFLEAPPVESMTKSVALADQAGLVKEMNGAYQIVGGAMFGGKVQVMNELLADQLDGVQLSGDFGEIFRRQSSVFGNYKNDFYKDIYQAIYRANVVLENLDAANTLKDNLEGQARFVRAICHFEAVKLWAQPYGYSADNSHLGIPLRLKTEAVSVPRSTVKQVYDQILADLKIAEVKLPDENNNYATKWAAKALLAKVYFQMNDFTNAYLYANQVIASNKFTLDTYASRFSETGCKESIFKITSNIGTFEAGGELRGQFRSDFNLPNMRFTTAFWTTVNTTNDARKALYDAVKYPGFIVTKKYNSDRFEIPVLYLTDMKLIRAESAAETNTNLTVALQDINEILARAYNGTRSLPVGASASLIRSNVRFERSIEMAGEGNRLSEIKRIGAKGENIDRRGANWNCNGLILQFPAGEQAASSSFVNNPEGGCN